MKSFRSRKRPMTGNINFAFFLIAISLGLGVQAQVPAFPTAEGYGMWATGGRGGKVVEVTTTNDNGSDNLVGSLRWALKQHSGQPLTVVFRVSGIIDLKGVALRSKRNNVTIAGQTAPGDGICIKGGSFNLGGSFNVIVRHLRFRTGAYTPDGKELNAATVIHENGGNFIYDHCSFSWSSEELCNISDGGNITVQWSIFSEGLYASVNGKGARGYGPVIAGSGASYHHNLIAHNVSRSPRFGVSSKDDYHILIDFVNNVNYNFGKKTACYGGENRMGSKGSVNINMVNNFFKQGPAYDDSKSAVFIRASYWVSGQGTAYSKWHLSGNYITGTANQHLNSNNYAGLDIGEYTANVSSCTINDIKSDRHEIKNPVATQSAQDAFNSVMLKSGAFPRDTVDRRVLYEAATGTASKHGSFNNHAVSGIIDKPEEAGGWPEYKTYNTIIDNDKDGMDDAWEIANGLDPADPEDRNKKTKSGYTCLEVYLNDLVGEKIELAFSGVGIPQIEQQKTKTFMDSTGSTLYFQSSKAIQSVTFFDLNGRKVYDHASQYICKLDISELQSGLYVLQMEKEDGSIERTKILK